MSLGPLQGHAEALLVQLWTRARVDWGWISDRLADAFRRERGLGSRERRQIAEALYATTRQFRRIEHALLGAGPVLRGDALARAELLAQMVLAGEVAPAAARETMPGVDWDHVAAVDARIAKERDPVRRLGLARSLPDWLAEKLLAERGPEEADALAAALSDRAPLAVRANRIKIDRTALATKLEAEGISTRPSTVTPDGLILETRTNVFGLAAFQAGELEVQDEASQLVAELVLPGRLTVVDFCAGAGGKALALGAVMGNKGRLLALDVHAKKLEELRRRSRRAGLTNVQALAIEEETWPPEVANLVGKADRVLVDAPCSGIGALRRNPEARWRLTPEDVARFPALQLAILRRASRLVTPGGRLIYATCTVLRDENQGVVEKFLAEDAGWTPIRPAEVLSAERAFGKTDASGTALELMPHRHGTDGFFAIALRRTGS